jgi:uncharacterized membrane protein
MGGSRRVSCGRRRQLITGGEDAILRKLWDAVAGGLVVLQRLRARGKQSLVSYERHRAYRQHNQWLTDNAAGALAYVTIIPGIVFLLIDPYKQKHFVRFHAFQSIFFSIAAFAVSFALALVPFLGFIGWASLLMLVRLGFFAIWVVLVVNAANGKMWELPVIGSFAKQQARVQSAGATGQTSSSCSGPLMRFLDANQKQGR